MKKLFMILALSLPLMAQEAEVKESVGKKVVRTIQDVEWSKSKSAHQRDHDKKGGMKRGDVIRRFDGVEISSMETLPKQVASIKPGKSVNVEVIREGQIKTLVIKIDPMKEEKPA